MTKKQAKKLCPVLSPMEARGDDVYLLQTDHKDLKRYWICTDGYRVSIHEQTTGEESVQQCTIPRKEFNMLIEWYTKPQKTRKPL